MIRLLAAAPPYWLVISPSSSSQVATISTTNVRAKCCSRYATLEWTPAAPRIGASLDQAHDQLAIALEHNSCAEAVPCKVTEIRPSSHQVVHNSASRPLRVRDGQFSTASLWQSLHQAVARPRRSVMSMKFHPQPATRVAGAASSDHPPPLATAAAANGLARRRRGAVSRRRVDGPRAQRSAPAISRQGPQPRRRGDPAPRSPGRVPYNRLDSASQH